MNMMVDDNILGRLYAAFPRAIVNTHIDYLERCADGLAPDFDNAVSLAVSALRAQQEAEKNEPLTLDELRKMGDCPDPDIAKSMTNADHIRAMSKEICSRPLTIIVLAVSLARARRLLLELCEANKDQMESWMQGIIPETASRCAKMRDGTRFIAMSCGADPNLLDGLIADEVFYEAAVWDHIPAALLARFYLALNLSSVPRDFQWHRIG